MKLTPLFRQELAERLKCPPTIECSMPLYDIVEAMVPYEIRDPAGAIHINDVLEKRNAANVYDLDMSSLRDEEFEKLWQAIRNVRTLSLEGAIAPQQEILLEKNFKEAHDILLKLLVEKTRDLAEYAAQRSERGVRNGAKKILDILRAQNPAAANRECALEAEENAYRDVRKIMFYTALADVTACSDMAGIMEDILAVIAKHRTTPETARLG